MKQSCGLISAVYYSLFLAPWLCFVYLTICGRFVVGRQLLENAGELLHLDRMMAKLYIQGHRVLIYSQFTRMLDILEDCLHLKVMECSVSLLYTSQLIF
jgi:hypothetical protein